MMGSQSGVAANEKEKWRQFPVINAVKDNRIHIDRSHGVVEAKPDYTNNRKPAYPKLARRRGWEGVVELSALVQTDGFVRELVLNKSSGFGVLDQAALKAVKGWLFQPGKRNGRVVEMKVRVPVRFKLN